MEKRIERMEKVEKPTERVALPLNFETGGRSGKRVLTVKDLYFGYGDIPVLLGVNLEILYRDRVCLFGANGSGKTTLLRLILKELSPEPGVQREFQSQTPGANNHLTRSNASKGEAHVHEPIIWGESIRAGYIPQEIRFADEKQTVVELFREEAKILENEARKILARYYFFGDAVYKRLSALSGGERVIIKLALLMQRRVNFLILDEPTNHLDIDTKELLEEALAEYNGTLLYVSHDRYFINKTARRVAYLHEGTLAVFEGGYDDFIKR
jgi:ATPase subunit of ABC transporter with duplicated ATPase domains